MSDLDQFLPAHLRGRATATALTGGLSGSGVYRIDTDGQAFLLKVASPDEPVDLWHRRRDIQRQASDAGLAPRVVHLDPLRRAVVTEFAVGPPFVALYPDPQHQARVIHELGDLLRQVHRLPLTHDHPVPTPLERLSAIRDSLAAAGGVPHFALDAIDQALSAGFPSDRRLVLSHNDVNPGNIVSDGARLLLVDWDAAGPNHPWFDLASIAMFARMDDRRAGDLLSAHDGTQRQAPPAEFNTMRRFVGILCGTTGLELSRRNGHSWDPHMPLASVMGLGEFYQQLRSGTLTLTNAGGQFGFALIKEATSHR